jgi:hypothetical protein
VRNVHFAGVVRTRAVRLAAVRLAAVSAVVLAAALVAGCSGGTQGSAPSAPALSSAPAHSASQSATPVVSASQQGLGVSPPPAPSASGQLHVLLHDEFPVTVNPGNLMVISTEAPDGSVFAAFGSEQADSVVAAPSGSAVFVVDGDQPVQIAEHPAIAVTALAADNTYLYAGGKSEIIAYSRATGAVAQTWSVTEPVRLLAASAGRLWAVLGSLAGGQINEITPGSSVMRTVSTDAANVESIAAGPRGIYYVESGGGTIVHVRPDGADQQAPTNQTVNLQLSGPGAIQAISVIGDQVLVVHDAGQGLDSSSQTYNASTLAGPLTNAPGTAGGNHAISSPAGPIDLVIGESTGATNEVGRYNLSTGAVTDAVRYPSSTKDLGPLLGPYPAVFVVVSGGTAYLDRIG